MPERGRCCTVLKPFAAPIARNLSLLIAIAADRAKVLSKAVRKAASAAQALQSF